VGVLTLYSSQAEHFTDEHRRLIETVTQYSAAALKRTATNDEPKTFDALTQLPFFSVGTSRKSEGIGLIRTESLILWIDIVSLKQINASYGRSAGNTVLCRTAHLVQAELQEGDSLFRYRSDEFIAILNSVDLKGAQALAGRISAKLQEPDFSTTSKPIDLTIKCVSVPKDAGNLNEILAAAKDISPATYDSHVH